MQTDESLWQALLDDLHLSPAKMAIVVAGGGSGAVSHCLRYAGASRTFVEAVVPYSRKAMAEYLGGEPLESSASLQAAKQLARRAQERAERLCDDEDSSGDHRYVGLSLVAALPSRSPRRGHDRIHVAIDWQDATMQWSLNLDKPSLTRSQAETISDEMLFQALATLVVGHNNERFFTEAELQVLTTR